MFIFSLFYGIHIRQIILVKKFLKDFIRFIEFRPIEVRRLFFSKFNYISYFN